MWLHRFALLTAAATAVLLFAGGLVTTTNSGDAVPDWWFVPLSFGSLLPPMTGGVLYEHGHRLVAGAVGLLTLFLAIWLQRNEKRLWVKRLGWLAFFGVCAQGSLGGARVMKLADPAMIAIVHACIAQAFFGLIVTIAVATSRVWENDTEEEEPSRLPYVALAATGLVYLQIVLGAVRRHTGWGINVHAIFALAVTAALLLACAEALRRGRFARTAALIISLLVAQVALGMWSYVLVSGGFVRSIASSKLETFVITGHLVVGALVYGTSLMLTVRSWKVFPRSSPRLAEASR